MNENHERLCPSPEWASFIQGELLPELAGGLDLGEEMLEIGPGPGASTAWLRERVGHLTAVEIDEEAAAALGERYAGSNVTVVAADAAALDWPDGSFDSVGTFTMLHHVPEVGLQDRILGEAYRILRPGGVLVGSDSLDSEGFRGFHEGDTCNPVDPPRLLGRLRELGFARIEVSVGCDLRFVAYKSKGEE
jgi:SAM-dependent methyltransferase